MVLRWAWMVVLLAVPRSLEGQVTFDAFGGTALNLHTQLTIHQRGQPDIDLNADYDTRPLEDTPYFGARVALWKNDKAWVGTFVHHKLYLRNAPPEVQFFRITYGFNMATIGRGWRHGNLVYTVGAGAVITHVANMVRGQRFVASGGPLNKGYTFSGVTANGSLMYKVPLSRAFYLSGETMVSASYIEVKVRDGEADVPQASLHLHAGFGLTF